MKQQLIDMGNRIKNRRKELNIKQSELAEQIGISNNHMSTIECGTGKPSIDAFLNICDILKVTPDYLLLGNIHADNVSQNIIDKLRLCNADDLWVIEQLVEAMVRKNSYDWNKRNHI